MTDLKSKYGTYINTKAFAKEFDMSQDKVIKLCKNDRLPSTIINNSYYIDIPRFESLVKRGIDWGQNDA